MGQTIPNRPEGRGFTLVEILAALLIFGLVVVALLEGLAGTTSIQGDLAAMQRAAMLAENVLEEVRLEGSLEAGETSGRFDGEDSAYGWKTTIAKTSTTDLMEVSVRVSWNTGRGEKDTALTTLLLSQGTSP